MPSYRRCYLRNQRNIKWDPELRLILYKDDIFYLPSPEKDPLCLMTFPLLSCLYYFLYLFAFELRKHNQLFMYDCTHTVGNMYRVHMNIQHCCQCFICIISWDFHNSMRSYYYYPYPIGGKTRHRECGGLVPDHVASKQKGYDWNPTEFAAPHDASLPPNPEYGHSATSPPIIIIQVA